MLANLAMDFASIVSKEYADKLDAEGKKEQLNQMPVGTGPFSFVGYQQDAVIRYKKNADYWGTAPLIDDLVFAITPDAAVRLQKLELEKAWQQRDPQSPLKTPYEALKMASIVEKETGLASDRGKVASVFVNRLRVGMLLQTDPTVIYGLGERFDGNLRKGDLQTDTVYNTYTRAGLPPTPIAMPGVDALRAVAKPAPGEHLYFVAVGDGSGRHLFAKTYVEHQANVRQYLLNYRNSRAKSTQ